MTPMLLALLCVGSLVLSEALPTSLPQKLLVILLDGCRWDYPHKANLLNFHRLQGTGAFAGYVINDFPTLSFPNYYTLMTGRHTETHGLSGNYMYAAKLQEYFLIGENPEHLHAHWWDGGEPLWVTATKQGKRAYMYYWPGCEVTIHGTIPTFCEPYQRVTTLDDFRGALNSSIHQLTADGGADLAMVYHEEPDHVGHRFGPDSPQVADTLKEIDAELGKLFDKLDTHKNTHKVNVIIMSDHGMTSISPNRIINITQVLTNPSLYVTIQQATSIASIYTENKQKTNEVYDLLKNFSTNMQVYTKEEIPERYHYKNGKYVADITCVADLGWAILHPLRPDFPQTDGENSRGYHGYDNRNKDMSGIFYAQGPYFQPKATAIYIDGVDPYNIMCDILVIEPAPNNGSRSRMIPLVYSSACHQATHFSMFAFGASSLTAIIMMILV